MIEYLAFHFSRLIDRAWPIIAVIALAALAAFMTGCPGVKGSVKCFVNEHGERG
jgi:hypothetical protein